MISYCTLSSHTAVRVLSSFEGKVYLTATGRLNCLEARRTPENKDVYNNLHISTLTCTHTPSMHGGSAVMHLIYNSFAQKLQLSLVPFCAYLRPPAHHNVGASNM